MTPTRRASKSREQPRRHGLFSLKRSLKERGLPALDQRTAFARELAAIKRGIASDLGDDLTTAQEAVLEAVVGGRAYLRIVDATLATHPEWIVNRRRRALAPLVKERAVLADSVLRGLQTLGLKRVPREVGSLRTYRTQANAEGLAAAAGENS